MPRAADGSSFFSPLYETRSAPESAPPRVLVIGGYGVFGGRLVDALLETSDVDVVVAGRARSKAERFV
ncbi:MAG: hypothetical protein AAFQ42_08455, partial [Pseudomonadota bacterium]